MHDKLLEMLMQKDEITWQSIIYDLIKTGEMDPWDIDISLLSQKYIEVIRGLQEANLFLSGKVILASAILLKIKSDKLLVEGIGALDNYLFPQEAPDNLDEYLKEKQLFLLENPKLTIKTPQARKKKISVNDLISALEKALEVSDRRILRHAERDSVPEMRIPEKRIDISELMSNVFSRVKAFFSRQKSLTFTELVNSDRKEDKIMTFVPLLHLSNELKVDLQQSEPFGEISIVLMNEIPVQKGLNQKEIANN
jgi:segregation and condensation protein A